MTSFKLSELPIPYRSAGASPLGTHEGTVTPPEPPTPPTPTGKVYFSGTSTNVLPVPDGFDYVFDPTALQNVEEFLAKQVGDELSVTINGAVNAWKLIAIDPYEEDGVTHTSYYIAASGSSMFDVPKVNVSFTDEGGQTAPEYVDYVTADEIPDGVTLTIADPA